MVDGRVGVFLGVSIRGYHWWSPCQSGLVILNDDASVKDR
jgi:hypothetical protein